MAKRGCRGILFALPVLSRIEFDVQCDHLPRQSQDGTQPFPPPRVPPPSSVNYATAPSAPIPYHPVTPRASNAIPERPISHPRWATSSGWRRGHREAARPSRHLFVISRHQPDCLSARLEFRHFSPRERHPHGREHPKAAEARAKRYATLSSVQPGAVHPVQPLDSRHRKRRVRSRHREGGLPEVRVRG